MPRGRVECIPRPPRPETPRQLPRPRVFISQPAGKSTNDTDFEGFMMRERYSDATSRSETITPSTSESSASSRPRRSSGWENAPEKTVTQLLQEEDDYYFSDDESVAGVKDLSKNLIKRADFAAVIPGDALSSKVHRVLSNLRSISFQNPAVEDPDTAWGQASAHRPALTKKSANNICSTASRWRRPRGRISSKNGVQEFECYSEADAASMHSYTSSAKHPIPTRRYNHRDALKSIQGLTGRHHKNIWNAATKRDRTSPITPNFLVGTGQDYLAAATTLNQPLHTVTAMVPAEPESQDSRRRSVDKYVEFIHASAQRESKNKLLSRNFTGRVLHRAQGLFRRKWKV
ncbi:unnamed protein product [Chondrus crispus]|uniref:Uncharacterized protein n=1 Tax=Chondrus crispus TaxID=2769 RepID=R7QG93_CHOCR|nr:unnamed protein product [Chondrus crispus]CDF37527.1 unnamed protein product [Chondrus crispus]|eukprot:XP_005717398.1 unnamed protein product [Chondrus crispus]